MIMKIHTNSYLEINIVLTTVNLITNIETKYIKSEIRKIMCRDYSFSYINYKLYPRKSSNCTFKLITSCIPI